jgi:hypothetical protein
MQDVPTDVDESDRQKTPKPKKKASTDLSDDSHSDSFHTLKALKATNTRLKKAMEIRSRLLAADNDFMDLSKTDSEPDDVTESENMGKSKKGKQCRIQSLSR